MMTRQSYLAKDIGSGLWVGHGSDGRGDDHTLNGGGITSSIHDTLGTKDSRVDHFIRVGTISSNVEGRGSVEDCVHTLDRLVECVRLNGQLESLKKVYSQLECLRR